MTYETLQVRGVGRTALAVRVRLISSAETVHIPRSLIEDGGDVADKAYEAEGLLPVVYLNVASWKVRQEDWN